MSSAASSDGASPPTPTDAGRAPVPAAERRARGLAHLLPGLFAAAAFGGATPAAKVLLDGVAPLWAAGWLYLASGAALSTLLAIRPPGAGRRVRRSDLPWLLASIAVGGVAAPVAFFLGLATGSASDVSLLLGVELPLTVGIAVLLFGERLDPWRVLGAALVTAGGGLVAWRSGGASSDLLGGGLTSALLIVAACLGWALDSNLTRFLAHRAPLDVARWKGLGAGVAALGLAIGLGVDRPALTPRFLLGGAAVGLVAYGLSFAGYVASVGRLGAARTGMLFGTAPLFGLAGAVWFLGEPVGVRELVPAGLMLLGVGLLGMERRAAVAVGTPPSPPSPPDSLPGVPPA